jgi:hypothetical protein
MGLGKANEGKNVGGCNDPAVPESRADQAGGLAGNREKRNGYGQGGQTVAVLSQTGPHVTVHAADRQ